MIALLLGACAGAASAQEVTMGSSNHPTTVGIQAGHASASAYDPQGHNFISGAHPNAQTKDANPKPVKGSEGQRRTYQGQELVFHQGEWHTVKETGKGEAAPSRDNTAPTRDRCSPFTKATGIVTRLARRPARQKKPAPITDPASFAG